MNQLPPPGWYPNPSGTGFRYWDGHNWGQVAPSPAPVIPPQGSVAPQRKRDNTAWILGGSFLALILVIFVGSSMAGRDKHSASSTTISTITPDVYIADTQSRLIDLSMRNGSEVTRSNTGTTELEIWRAPDDVRTEIERVRRLLPIGKPLNGVAWCKSDWNRNLNLMVWTWADSTEWITVSVGNDHTRGSLEPDSGSEVTITHTQSDEGC